MNWSAYCVHYWCSGHFYFYFFFRERLFISGLYLILFQTFRFENFFVFLSLGSCIVIAEGINVAAYLCGISSRIIEIIVLFNFFLHFFFCFSLIENGNIFGGRFENFETAPGWENFQIGRVFMTLSAKRSQVVRRIWN